MKQLIVVFIAFVMSSCAPADPVPAVFTPMSMKATIVERGKAWGTALATKDISLLADLYAKDAHYLPDDSAIIRGREAILSYWEVSMPFMNGLTLSMETLEGTKELLYETGQGVAQVMNEEGTFDDFRFKYVNVWALQANGDYQVVIDMYNNLE